jgi:hypothetical protein
MAVSGIKIPKATGVKVPKPGSIPTPKIPTVRSNPMGKLATPKGFPRVMPPRIKPLQTRMYAKGAVRQDPGMIPGGGFGGTGLTGES